MFYLYIKYAITSLEKSRSLESANDAKTGEQSVFGKSTQIKFLERHKEPYTTANWTRKRGCSS